MGAVLMSRRARRRRTPGALVGRCGRATDLRVSLMWSRGRQLLSGRVPPSRALVCGLVAHARECTQQNRPQDVSLFSPVTSPWWYLRPRQTASRRVLCGTPLLWRYGSRGPDAWHWVTLVLRLSNPHGARAVGQSLTDVVKGARQLFPRVWAPGVLKHQRWPPSLRARPCSASWLRPTPGL